jgi:hypothetical protein
MLVTVTHQLFRQRFEEFADPAVYRDIDVDFYLDLASGLVNASRFGRNTAWAVMLFVAHNLVIDARNAIKTQAGGIPGSVVGPTVSSTVGPISTTYDVTSTSVENEGFWGNTTYGKRLYQLIRMAGAGPIHVM